jgi:hypothetical protein
MQLSVNRAAAFISVDGLGAFETSAPKTNAGDANSAAPPGRVYGLPNPGLKPWAILCRHFMAILPITPSLHHSITFSFASIRVHSRLIDWS